MTENLITLEEVSKHNTQQSTWLVIDSKVCFRFIFKHFFFLLLFSDNNTDNKSCS